MIESNAVRYEPLTPEQQNQMLSLIAQATGMMIEAYATRNDAETWIRILGGALGEAYRQQEAFLETTREQAKKLGIEPGTPEAAALGLR